MFVGSKTNGLSSHRLSIKLFLTLINFSRSNTLIGYLQWQQHRQQPLKTNWICYNEPDCASAKNSHHVYFIIFLSLVFRSNETTNFRSAENCKLLIVIIDGITSVTNPIKVNLKCLLWKAYSARRNCQNTSFHTRFVLCNFHVRFNIHSAHIDPTLIQHWFKGNIYEKVVFNWMKRHFRVKFTFTNYVQFIFDEENWNSFKFVLQEVWRK